jgi:hypothetical protein
MSVFASTETALLLSELECYLSLVKWRKDWSWRSEGEGRGGASSSRTEYLLKVRISLDIIR